MNSDYDVAFSYLAEDEALANTLSSRLRERYSVFHFPEAQKEIAGRDGIEVFGRVFGRDARVCVVLYRSTWGHTKWTRIEETAIKERALEQGWEFLLVISLDGGQSPVWLPKTKIWLGYEAYGADAAIGAIDSKIAEAGGVPVTESPGDKARRIGELSERRQAREVFLACSRGLVLAGDEVRHLQTHLERHVSEIVRAPGMAGVRFIGATTSVTAVSSPALSVSFGWHTPFQSSLHDAALTVRYYDGLYLPQAYGGGPQLIEEHVYIFSLGSDDEPQWMQLHDSQLISTVALANAALHRIIDALG
ncbi:MAG: hypothetical protein ABIZ70_06940 [Gemmatimonadales bacterium]